jgi:hypothetical protein
MFITKEHNKLTFGIYQKPTTIDFIIYNDSCHSNEHKKLTVNYLINYMNTYLLTQTNKDQEQLTIKKILKKNGYQRSIINHKHTNKFPLNSSQTVQKPQKEKEKWVTSPISALRLEQFFYLIFIFSQN